MPKIEEQIAIEVVLDTVDEAIAKTEAVIAKLKQVRAGLLHDLLTGGLDENGQLRDPIAHPEQFQDSPLGAASEMNHFLWLRLISLLLRRGYRYLPTAKDFSLPQSTQMKN